MSIVKASKLVIISSWLVVVLWLVLIFTLSVQTAEQSAGLSGKVTETIIKVASCIVPIDTDVRVMDQMVKQFHNLVRKFAHGWLYFVLGVLVLNSFIKTGVKGVKAYVYALIFCVAYAVTDEGHQTFVVGRSGQISDVLIDTVGAMVGISLYWICKICKNKMTCLFAKNKI